MGTRTRSRPRLLAVNGADLCVQTFGDAGSPAILLIGGAASSMDWWEDEFCERLARSGRCVIRYDLRDTGQSTSYEPGSPGYDGMDLVADAAGLLDALEIARAHVVGISMGGGIAQRLALDHRDRIASLTLISASPGGAGPEHPDLPPMSDRLEAFFADPPSEPDWSDRAAVIDYIVAGERPFRGSRPFDEAGLRTLAARVLDRTANIASSLTNHWILEATGEPTRPRLGEIRAPTLVLHGTEDPLFPYGHAEALAREIPGARLVPLEGVGHEMPPRAVWDRVVAAIVDLTSPR